MAKVGPSPSKKVGFVWLNASPTNMIKYAFCFTSKAIFVLKIFKYLSWCFRLCRKKLKKAKVNFKIYGVTTWETNNCNTFMAQYLKKQRQSDNLFGQLLEYDRRNIFFEKPSRKWCSETSSRSIFAFQKSLYEEKIKWSVPRFQHVLVLLNLDKQ